MSKFYVTGGQQNKGAKGHIDWFCYAEAWIMAFDESGSAEVCTTYKSPDEFRPDAPRSNIVFKVASRDGDRLLVTTQTEILVYSLPDFRRLDRVTHPWLNDVHHVIRNEAGNYLVANTGLDQVLELDGAGGLVREWNVLDEPDTWKRFDRDVDYRKVVTTKPHLSHPNFVFEYDGEIWVSRFVQRDIVCLGDPDRRIDVGIQSLHDGNLFGSRVYVTTVDGHIVIGDLADGRRVAVHDLNEMTDTEKALGWCRGLHILDEDRVIVGFSRLRPSRIKENLRWVKFKIGMSVATGYLPTRVACYNLTEGRLEWELNLEEYGLNAVFSIVPAD